MKKSVKSALIRYGITVLVCAGLTYLYISLRDFAGESLMEKYRILCDAFMIPGALAILSGLLVFVSNEGAFEGIGYALKNGIRALIPIGNFKPERFGDYLERRRAKGKVKGYGFLFIVGGVFLLISIFFLILFYQLYNA